MTSRDEAQIRRALSGYTPSELRVDEARNRQDVSAYLTELAKEHVELEVTMDSLCGRGRGQVPGLEEPRQVRGSRGPCAVEQGAYDEAIRGVPDPRAREVQGTTSRPHTGRDRLRDALRRRIAGADVLFDL